MAVEKGITITFRGNDAPLKSAINKIRTEAKTLDKELGYIDKSLKFNPTSVALWSQKQKTLTQNISETNTRLGELKDMQKQLEAKDIDRNSEEYRELEREIVKCEQKLKEYKKELNSMPSARVRALAEGFKKVGTAMTEAGKQLTTKVTVPLGILGAKATQSFAEVDKIMTLTNKTMNNTSEQAELLNNAMKDAAANSTYGMEEAATATLNFARAGLTAEQSASALAPAMNLAAGEGGNLDTVSAGLVATINGFHGSFEEAGHYADVFANACNNSALDVDSLSSAMSVAAPIFASAGYSIEDAALYMGVMANNGIDADKAANSLKTGIARLVSPAKDGADKMKELGISVTNADGTMKDSVTIQKELHDAFSKLSESEQIAAASAIFGKNQMAPWLALINTAPGDLSALSESLGVMGTTGDMANAMMSGFGGSLEKLKSSLDVAVYSLGQALVPVIEKVVGWIQQLVDWFNGLDSSTQTIIATVGAFVAVLGPVLVIVGTLLTAIGNLMTFVPMIIGAISGIGSTLLAVTGIIGVVIAAGVLMYKNWDKIKEYAGIVKDWVVKTWTQLKTSVSNIFNAVKTTVTTIWTNIKTSIMNVVNGIKTTVSNAFNSVKNTVSSIFNTIKTIATGAWNGIKFAITHPIDAAVLAVKLAISKIKSFFSGLHLKLPDIKLPHFKLSGKLSLAPPSVPKLSIDWYKNGGIFTQPTIFGGVGVGEAGAEAVLPLKKLWEEMDKRFSTPSVVINVNAPQGMDVNELAAEIERRLINSTKRRKQAWA